MAALVRLLLDCPCAGGDAGKQPVRAVMPASDTSEAGDESGDFSDTASYLEILAREAGCAFAAALQRLAEQEQQIWKDERQKIQEEWQQLEMQKQAFEDSFNGKAEVAPGKKRGARVRVEEGAKRTPAPSPAPSPAAVPASSSELVDLNVGGEASVQVSRSALTQCEGSRLAAEFSADGARDLRKDQDGHVLIDFAPAIFMPLVDHLKIRLIEAPGRQQPPPVLPDPDLDKQFVDMLRHYGMLDWVYRQRPMDYQVRIDDYDYAVLPPQPPDMGQVLNEMRGFTVKVPRGWQILNVFDDGFDKAVWELTKRGWGTSALLIQEADRAYAGYCTPLCRTGVAGSRLEEGETPLRWFDTVSEGGSRLKFATASYRLVIRRAA